ncbi:hypothetical protein X992_5968 [Burkholderia pseudomallei MSHR5492]|nr:hypothetical protein X989_5801 [Burkholderia pseudomallei MSHR4378]KGS36236.1 hypothetical protein X992_5968 [Burkholderia pseudomallei MSHR5492]
MGGVSTIVTGRFFFDDLLGVAAGAAASDLTRPSIALSRSSAVRFSLVVMSGRAWKPLANWEGFIQGPLCA